MKNRIVDTACWLLLFALAVVLVMSITFLQLGEAQAHEIHHQDDTTTNYSNWTNGLDKGCCNNQDCGIAKDEDVKYSPSVQVRINDKWCPVLSHHYLKKGGASNPNFNHVCVQLEYLSDEYGNELPRVDPCERLLCFQPRPLF